MHPNPIDTIAIIHSPFLSQLPFILPIEYVTTAPKILLIITKKNYFIIY